MTTSSPSTTPVARPWTQGIGGVALRTGLTAVIALVAAEVSVLAVVLGFSWLALIAAVASLAAGLTVWRRGLLPCAVVASAIAVPAAVAHHDPVRIDPSHGVLVVRPASVGDLQPSYRRGFGSVLVDLRRTSFGPGTVDLSARSDTGRVVVALPRDVCLNVRVR